MTRVPGWIPRNDRDGVLLSGSATLPDGREIPISLTNLSRDGCRVQSDETLGVGEVIRINVEALEGVVGTIRWSLLGTAGVRFDAGDWT